MVRSGRLTTEFFNPTFTSPNNFEPTGMNDDIRLDLTDQEFFAIDPSGSEEIDDAIRLRETDNGGFQLQVAIADVAQLDHESDHFERAVQKGRSIYGQRTNDLMLDREVIRALELRGDGEKRALVVSLGFDEENQPLETTIEPAWVKVRNIYYKEKVDRFLNKTLLLSEYNPAVQEGSRRLAKVALREMHGKSVKKFVGKSMALANIAVAGWVRERDVPVPFRIYDPDVPFISEDGTQFFGHYSPDPQPHAAFAEVYGHYTSPLRRAPDAAGGMQISAKLAGCALPFSHERIAELSRTSTLLQAREMSA